MKHSFPNEEGEHLFPNEEDRTDFIPVADLPCPPCRRCTGEEPGDFGGFCSCRCHEGRDQEVPLSLDPPVDSLNGGFSRSASEFAAAAAAAAACNVVVAQAAAAAHCGQREDGIETAITRTSSIEAHRVMPKSKVKFPDDRKSLLTTIPYCGPYVGLSLGLYALFLVICGVHPVCKILWWHLQRSEYIRGLFRDVLRTNALVAITSAAVPVSCGDDDQGVQFYAPKEPSCPSAHPLLLASFGDERYLPTLWRCWAQLLFCLFVHFWAARHHIFHLVRQRIYPYDREEEFKLGERFVHKAGQLTSALKPQPPLCGRYGFVNLKGRVRNILALINPTSGGRMAMTYYQKLILPITELCANLIIARLLYGVLSCWIARISAVSSTVREYCADGILTCIRLITCVFAPSGTATFVWAGYQGSANCARREEWRVSVRLYSPVVARLRLVLDPRGDGSYHSIVNLLVRASLEKRRDVLQEGDEEDLTQPAPEEGKSPASDDSLPSSTRRNVIRSPKCQRCKEKKCIFPVNMPITPVPLGTSNTWCSEFVFSHAGSIAAKCYAANARQLAAAAMEQVEKEKAKASRRSVRHPNPSCSADWLTPVQGAGDKMARQERDSLDAGHSKGASLSLSASSLDSSAYFARSTSTAESCETNTGGVCGTPLSAAGEFVDPVPQDASGNMSLYQVLPGICDSSRDPSVAARAAALAAFDVATLARNEASAAAAAAEKGTSLHGWDSYATTVAVEAEESAAVAQAACAAAERAAQAAEARADKVRQNPASSPSHHTESPAEKAMEEFREKSQHVLMTDTPALATPAAQMVASMAALSRHDSADLLECSRLLAPAPTPELKGVRLAKHHLRVAKMMDELAEKMGPGKDSNMMQMGRERLLHFWMRRIHECRTTRINALLVEAGGERHLCCNSLEFGFIGTAQVHSEDMRWTGHMRYTLAFLYQLLMRRTFPAYITATLPNGEVIHRIGNYMVVALDVIQHWTDDRPIARQAQMDGPCAWLLLMDGSISRARLWAYMRDLRRLSMAEEKGLEMLPVKRVHIKLTEPGIYGLDGEVYRHGGELTFTLLPGPIRVCVSEFDQLIAHPVAGHRWMKHILQDLD
ncbi:hypothetical protein BESB_013190 [Besnoitia besnoiti]|uniref:Uncharacterized protein n=1 Tax=Besnoitia besnoiti TaxID=94643 RepID=A0A2A9MAR6_BESBE|nr:hypothetical protein BESB_013190 [Besnoitia besnoiti]PFH32707.1 hypothetical protein BESB_013190 [Besnoitia besnoiti]